MGISGLLPFVRKSCRPANLKDFSGATVAIDAYSWLHKGAFSCAEKLVKGEQTDGYIYYCLKLLNMILEAGLKPIMVFDGCNLKSKEGTEKKRRENREKNRLKGKELLCEGKIKEARECFQRCVDVTSEMARQVIVACRRKSIDCIVAPYEADAQLAYLNKIGMAQIIITEDSDLILFGCDKILFKMDNCGLGLLYEKENLSKSFGAKAMKFSFDKFRYMCILSGCDYLPSLPGIGLVKAYKFFSLTDIMDLNRVLSKVPSYLKMPNLVVSEEYKESFLKANNTFLYQLAFCPEKKCLVPLNPYPEDMRPEDLEYAGKYLPDDIVLDLAMGNINVKTMLKFSSSQGMVNRDKSVVWGSQKIPTKESYKPAFKFNTPKHTLPQKRELNTECSSEVSCTDEELFSMYQSTKRICPDKASHIEDLPSESTSTSPYLPFRKIVRSRFFSADKKDDPCSSQSTSEDISNSVSTQSSSEFSEDSFVLELNSSPPSDQLNIDISALTVSTQKKDNKNKENIRHMFAKEKISDATEHSSSTPNEPSGSTWLDILEDETDSSTCTLSSSGYAHKLIDSDPSPETSSSRLRRKPRLIATKLSRFRCSKKLSRSLRASVDEGFESSRNIESDLECSKTSGLECSKTRGLECSKTSDLECSMTRDLECSKTSDLECSKASDLEYSNTRDLECPKTRDLECPKTRNSDGSMTSPYFGSLTSNSEDVVILSDSEEESTIVEHLTEKTVKVLSPIDNKNSQFKRCRTLGLPRTKRASKVTRKETLLSFNFVRQRKSDDV